MRLIIVLSLLLLVDCSKPLSDIPAKMLSYQVSVPGTPGWRQTFEYNSNGQLTKFSYGTDYTAFTYDQQGRVNSWTYHDQSSSFSYAYHYDASNRVISLDGQFPTSYSYNSSGQLIKQTQSDGAYAVFEYPNNSTANFSSVTRYDEAGNIYKVTTFIYDSKKNPFYPLLYNFYLGQPEDVPTPNNVVSMTTNENGSTNEVTNSYTYNSQGLPTAINGWFGHVAIKYLIF